MNDKDVIALVGFELGAERFGAALGKIQEIIRHSAIVKIPRAPDFLEGIINLRGRVIPVIDLGKRFNMRGAEKGAKSRIIVAEVRGVRAGLSVDSVSKVLRAPAGSFEKTPALVSGIDRKFIAGVVKDKEGMLLVLDLDEIFTPEETDLLRQVD